MNKDLTPYKLLYFQYKPLEDLMRKHLGATSKEWQKYQKFSDYQKVFILDKIAQEVGL